MTALPEDHQVTIGIVGAGGMGRSHFQHYLDVGGNRVVAVCDPVVEAAEALADWAVEHGAARPQVYGDLAALLEAESPDAISVCTPPSSHVAAAGLALQHGTAVLCEKPPTRTGAELTELITTVGEQAPLQFGLCHVFHPPVQQAKEMINSGKIGEVVHLNIRFAFRFDGVADRWFTDPEVAGGGVVLDTLVHSISVFRELAGEPRTVSAFLHTATPGVRVEDSAVIVLQAESGAVGMLQASWATPSGGAVVNVHCTDGELMINYAEPALRHRIGTDPEWHTGEASAEGRFHGQARSFLTAVRTGQVSDNTIADARATMAVIDAAYASARQGGVGVTLSSQ